MEKNSSRGLGAPARKRGRNFGRKARHLVLDLRVRFQADIKIKDDFVEDGGFRPFSKCR
jgi:hypothetical protein